jgi:hypothetical protein
MMKRCGMHKGVAVTGARCALRAFSGTSLVAQILAEYRPMVALLHA